jgi:hypothetical protein
MQTIWQSYFGESKQAWLTKAKIARIKVICLEAYGVIIFKGLKIV